MTNLSGTNLNIRLVAGPGRREDRESPSRLLKYAEYKDSGVEWLGEVPVDWRVDRFKASITSCRNGIWGADPTGDVDDIECVRVADFDRARLVVDGEVPTLRSVTEKERADRLVRAGDLLLEKSGGGEKQPVGQVVLYDRPTPAVCSNFVAKVTLADGMVPRFWMYQHAAAYARGVNVGSIKQTSGIQNLDQSQYFNERGVFPSENEQSVIAAFLDRETCKIDALIAEQEKLLTLLAEKRQATISHAVTRGLNPNAPMRDSGVPWLGEVPAHWEVVPIRHLSSVQRGASPRPIDDPKYFDEEGEYSWVRIADVSASNGYLESTTQQLSGLGSSLSVKLKPGDLFVSIAGTVGKPCISKIKACIHDGFVYFPRLELPPIYLYRIFEAGVCYVGLGKMGTQLNLNTDTIGSIKLAIPPAEELNNILAFLAKALGRLDSLRAEADRGIGLLKERRSALIAAAVTGKIDVRGLMRMGTV